MNHEAICKLLNSKTKIGAEEMVDLGIIVGKLYTDHGLPIDIALDHLEKKRTITKEQQLLVLDGACQWLIEHKRNSGADERSIERQRGV